MDEVETADHAFLDGRLMLREPRRGHRSGTDAILLAAASRVTAGQHVVDVGAGSGAVALAILSRVESATATLVERDPAMAALARHNIEVNGFGARATLLERDIFQPGTGKAQHAAGADVVVSNPPFYRSGTVQESVNRQRAASHVLPHRDHGDWLLAVLKFSNPKGRVVVIHRPDALPSLLKAAEGRGAMCLRTIHPRPGETAHRILLEITSGNRAPFAVHPPLILHGEDGRFTAFAEDLHRGRSWL